MRPEGEDRSRAVNGEGYERVGKLFRTKDIDETSGRSGHNNSLILFVVRNLYNEPTRNQWSAGVAAAWR
ncbi:hypothetical protein GA0061098_103157 [Bradyrhizobium shewense]|uniref:Uncharacterized protein n=2 Tax=Bradyrhizobium shewense TaxID=1761772 RepID=A0A1C3XRI9_9BRAD|nr:hypothetical protein GA0061098_103157 [Bradyrhizobium shewense]